MLDGKRAHCILPSITAAGSMFRKHRAPRRYSGRWVQRSWVRVSCTGYSGSQLLIRSALTVTFLNHYPVKGTKQAGELPAPEKQNWAGSQAKRLRHLVVNHGMEEVFLKGCYITETLSGACHCYGHWRLSDCCRS